MFRNRSDYASVQRRIKLEQSFNLNSPQNARRLTTEPTVMNKQLANVFRVLLLFFALQISAMAADTPKISIFTSILPQKFFVEQLAGDLAEVEVMVGPDMSPHTYEPLPQQMSRLSRARLFFTIGVPFEKAIEKRLKAVCPNLSFVATNLGVEYHQMESFAETHVHSEDCSHPTGQPDPHIWLDPYQVMIQADNIAAALKEVLPDQTGAIDERLTSFKTRLNELNEELSQALLPVKGQTMLVFHPAFGYFARRFNLKQQAVEIEGKEPGPRQLVELIRKCRAENIRVIFVQKQFPVNSARTIAEAIDGAVVQIDPLAEDYFANLRTIAKNVSGALIKK